MRAAAGITSYDSPALLPAVQRAAMALTYPWHGDTTIRACVTLPLTFSLLCAFLYIAVPRVGVAGAAWRAIASASSQ